MRFAEYENEATGNLEWLIRKDGCMHCEDPGCLKACPSPGAIISTPTASWTSTRKTASAAATA
jgi:Fe-S-cluster-containing dehydrogenase component